MNRRSFFKFIGIGAATAAVAPKVLVAQTPEYYPEAHYPITLDILQTAYAQTVYPTYAGYSRSVTVDIGTERMLSVTEQRYSDMMEQLVLTIDNKLRMDAGEIKRNG
jgi:hypothetical protein